MIERLFDVPALCKVHCVEPVLKYLMRNDKFAEAERDMILLNVFERKWHAAYKKRALNVTCDLLLKAEWLPLVKVVNPVDQWLKITTLHLDFLFVKVELNCKEK